MKINELIAKSNSQLALALKLAYSHMKKSEFKVDVRESVKGKIYYAVIIEADEAEFAELESMYRSMSQ